MTEAGASEPTLGFLHVGRPESGVRRYGRILADEATGRADLRVIQADSGELLSSLGYVEPE